MLLFLRKKVLDVSAIVVIFQWTQIQKDWTVWSPIPSTTHINLTKKNVIFFWEPGNINTHFLVVFSNGIRLDCGHHKLASPAVWGKDKLPAPLSVTVPDKIISHLVALSWKIISGICSCWLWWQNKEICPCEVYQVFF